MKDNRRSGRSPRKESSKRSSKDSSERRPSGFKKSRGRNEDTGESGFRKRSGTSDRPKKYGDQSSDSKESRFRKGSGSTDRFKKYDDRGDERRESRFGKKTSSDDRSEKRGDRFPNRENRFKKGPESFDRNRKYSDRKEDGDRSGFRKKYSSDERPRDRFSDKKEGGFKKRSDSSDRFKKSEDRRDNTERSRFRSKPEGSRFKRTDSNSQSGEFKRKPYTKKSSGRSRVARVPSSDASGLIRLNKFISNSGVCSRREADELIKIGLVTVNGQIITEMGHKVKPTDDVRYEGRRLHAEMPVYILLNKPKGFITTTDDPQERKTVMSLIAGACKERVYPVGRLDRNTTGLLLFTNDGELADKLTHPSYNIKKIYKVELDKPLTKNDLTKLTEGIRLEEGVVPIDDVAIVSDDKKTVGIELHIGWNRVVRRIFETLGYDVVKLDRSVYAGLDKKDTPRGKWRFLKPEEIVHLKHYK